MRSRWLYAAGLFSILGCGYYGGGGGGGYYGGGDPGAYTGGGGAAAIVKTLKPLSQAPVPKASGGNVYNATAAIALGKALFWDMQVGSDGHTACATCHFSAGADARLHNSVHPGPDSTFAAGGVSGPEQLAQLINISADDRFGSQGVPAATFVSLPMELESSVETCTPASDPVFHSGRQVTGRNTPSIVGAVFFRELFWDGRASGDFNGADPFGNTANTQAAGPLIRTAALASQAMGPPLNPAEMACAGRTFQTLAQKLLPRRPLRGQKVSATDSVLGGWSASPEAGLRCDADRCTYRDWFSAAFGAAAMETAETDFARLFGQALLAYQSTLIPDQTPLDRFLGGDTSAMTSEQQLGFAHFAEFGCVSCHVGSELSDATVAYAASNGLKNQDGGDQGFHDIGVRPVSAVSAEDLGRAGQGPRGATFSVSGSIKDRGAFKTPMLRNVKLTAPYFHNGAKASLSDVLDFYARGGDFRGSASSVRALAISTAQRAALLAFLSDGLTDCRTEKARAPFDHPSLEVTNGPLLPEVGAEGTGPCP